jgi:tetratricopeptide (TPR) repeat protein
VPKFIVSIFVFCFIAAFPAHAQVDSVSLSLQLAKGMEKRYNQADQAQTIFEQVLVQAKQKGIFIIQLEAYKQLAQLEILGARYGHAKELVAEALAVAEMANLPIKKAELGYLLATVFHAQGDFTKALERYLESLRVFEALNKYQKAIVIDIGSIKTKVLLEISTKVANSVLSRYLGTHPIPTEFLYSTLIPQQNLMLLDQNIRLVFLDVSFLEY